LINLILSDSKASPYAFEEDKELKKRENYFKNRFIQLLDKPIFMFGQHHCTAVFFAKPLVPVLGDKII